MLKRDLAGLGQELEEATELHQVGRVVEWGKAGENVGWPLAG
jgi:hypothetical protein